MKTELTKRTLAHLPDHRKHGYRSRRSEGELLHATLAAQFCRAIRNALEREARLAKLANTSPDALDGISEAWVGGVRAR